ncbi:MAG: response regulator [Bacteroidota bacterium]
MSTLKTILIVEDDPFDAEMTLRALKEIPLANPVEVLETGQEFLEYLSSGKALELAVVLLDLSMPQVSGIEALEIIRASDYPSFPIVVLTSSSEAPDIKRCYELGVNSFVTKPVKQQAFKEAINTLGLYWGIINKIP